MSDIRILRLAIGSQRVERDAQHTRCWGRRWRALGMFWVYLVALGMGAAGADTESPPGQSARKPADRHVVFRWGRPSEMREGTVTVANYALLSLRGAPIDRLAAGSVYPALRADFEGLGDNATAIPPDTQGAVGPRHLMVVLNSEVAVQTRQGKLLKRVSLSDFWAGLGGAFVFDPRVVYDHEAARWYMVAIADPRTPQCALLVGTSRGEDPAGEWDLCAIDVDDADQVWADYPNLGFNRHWVVATVNTYGIATNQFAGAEVFVLFKPEWCSGGRARYERFSDPDFFTVVPAVTYDVAEPVLHLAAENGVRSLRLSRIEGPPGNPRYVTNAAFTPVAPEWRFSTASTNYPGGTNSSPQAGTNVAVFANDSRVQAVVVRNGAIWCAHHIFLTDAASSNVNRSSIQWWQLQTNGSVLQRGRIDDSAGGVHYSFPSLAVNRMNDMLIGYSSFSADRYPSANYAFRMAADPPGTVRGDVVYKAGVAPYVRLNARGRNSWGDFSSAWVDPLNDMDMWTLQEYAEAPVDGESRWGTWWGWIGFQPHIPPSILVPPSGRELSALDEEVRLRVEASGSEPMEFQWKRDDTNVMGATSSELVLSRAGEGWSGWYAVVVSNAAGYALSDKVYVGPVAPRIVTPPVGSAVMAGAALNLSVEAVGTLPLSYQWFKGDQALEGETNAHFSLSGFSEAHAGSYRVEISNAWGRATSPEAILTLFQWRAPRLSRPTRSADGTFEFSLAADRGSVLEVHFSTNLVAWTRYFVFTNKGEIVILQLQPPPKADSVFYRALAR